MEPKLLNRIIPGRSRWWLIPLLLLALGLRLFNIDAASLWIDETYSLMVANMHLPPAQLEPAVHPARYYYDHYLAWQPMRFDTLLALLRINVHMPLYYLLLNPWLGLFGNTETGLRSFSALFSVLAVIPVYFLGRSLAGPRAGLLAGLVMAVAPYQIYYGQEGRMYALSLFWATLSALTLWKTLYGRRPLPWSVLYAVSVLFGFFTHYLFVFFLAAQAVYAIVWLVRNRDWGRFGLLTFALTALLIGVAGWFPIYQAQQQGVDAEYHFAKGLVGWPRYLTALVWQPLVAVAGDNKLERIFYLPFSALLFLWYLGQKLRAGGDERLSFRVEGFLLFWLLAPLGFQIGYDLLKQTHTVVVDRYILLISPAMALWLGLALNRLADRFGRKPVATLIGVMLLLAVANVWVRSPFRDEQNKKDLRGQFAYMFEHARPGDLVFVNGPLGAAHLAAWYLVKERPTQPMIYWINEHQGQPVPLPDKRLLAPYGRVWLFRNRANNERGLQDAKEHLQSMFPHLQYTHDWFLYSPAPQKG